jgi:HK97 family phage prohead protease
MDKIFHIGSTFKSFNEGDDLYIAGYASTNNMDRVGDVVESEAWTKGGLDNYQNNPIILFNHDYNQPIGRAVGLKTGDNGLELKAKIAKSAGQVGELIKEGILGAFSVGFRVKDAEYMTETDGYKIKDAELLEVSVVAVPANQAATFSIAKSFNSMEEYEDFKLSFKQDEPSISEEIQTEEDSMPNDLSQVEAKEKTMSDIDIDAIVSAAVEKTAAAMAMKEAERKAEEKAAAEAEQKAAAEADAQKSAEEERVRVAVQTGAEKLLEDVEKRFADKDADHMQMVADLQKELAEKSEEIEKIRNSKRVFADRGEVKSFTESHAQEITDAHILGVVTQKGWETGYAKSLFEKAVNDNTSVEVDSLSVEAFETTVSTEVQRDIELELVIDPLFRKIQMNSAAMAMPLMPDAGYAEFLATGSTAGRGSGTAFKGNLESRDDTAGSPYPGIDMGSKVLTVKKIVSNTYLANEVEEDAIMPVLPLIREAMVRAHARAIENALLLGTTGAGGAGSFSGLVELGGNDVDFGSAGETAAGQITAANLLDMRQSMGKYGRRPGDVVYIVSLDAYYDLLDDPEFQDVNIVGSERATKISGEIGQVYGSPVIVCDEFPAKANGAYWGVAVNPRNFIVPVLRGVTIEQDYEVANQQRVLVASQRRGFDLMFANDAGAGDYNAVGGTW